MAWPGEMLNRAAGPICEERFSFYGRRQVVGHVGQDGTLATERRRYPLQGIQHVPSPPTSIRLLCLPITSIISETVLAEPSSWRFSTDSLSTLSKAGCSMDVIRPSRTYFRSSSRKGVTSSEGA